MPLTTMLDPMETEDTTHRSVLDNLHGADKGTYRVATGTRKEVEGLRIAVRNAGFQVRAKRNKDAETDDEYQLLVTVRGGVNEDEPQADPESDTSTDNVDYPEADTPSDEREMMTKPRKGKKQDEQPADVAAALF